MKLMPILAIAAAVVGVTLLAHNRGDNKVTFISSTSQPAEREHFSLNELDIDREFYNAQLNLPLGSSWDDIRAHVATRTQAEAGAQ